MHQMTITFIYSILKLLWISFILKHLKKEELLEHSLRMKSYDEISECL